MTKNASDTISYRAVIKQIPLAERKELMALTNRHGLLHITAHLGLIGLCAYGQVALDGIFAMVALLGQGICMCFLFCAMHEASHGTAFRAKALNHFVCWLAGFILMMGPKWFRNFHAAHHRHTQDLERDPELASPKPDDWRSYLIYLSGLPIWWSAVVALIGNGFGQNKDSFISQTARPLIHKEARLMLLCYAIVGGGLLFYAPVILWQFWLLPILVGQPFLRLFLLAEHQDCPYQPDMLSNSRTIYTNRLLLALSWSMPYHSAHHSLPAVPFHKLARFHAHIRAHVRSESQGYHAFHKQVMKQL